MATLGLSPEQPTPVRGVTFTTSCGLENSKGFPSKAANEQGPRVKVHVPIHSASAIPLPMQVPRWCELLRPAPAPTSATTRPAGDKLSRTE